MYRKEFATIVTEWKDRWFTPRFQRIRDGLLDTNNQ